MSDVNKRLREVGTKRRLYTDRRFRRNLYLPSDPQAAQGSTVNVIVSVTEEIACGFYIQKTDFNAELGYYGEIYIPVEAYEQLDLSVGDTVTVEITPLEPISESAQSVPQTA